MITSLLALAFSTVAAADLGGFRVLPEDPPPAEITRGSHYWIGNEDRLDVFYDDVSKDAVKGGVHMGVGAEQNWMFIGWSKPEVAVMFDFDQAIVDLHRVYFVAFAAAATKEEFKALWLDKSRKGLRAGVIATYPKGLCLWRPRRRGVVALERAARWPLRLRHEARSP